MSSHYDYNCYGVGVATAAAAVTTEMNSESTATNETAVPTTNGDSGSHVTVDDATAGLIVTRKRSKSTEAGVYDSLIQSIGCVT